MCNTTTEVVDGATTTSSMISTEVVKKRIAGYEVSVSKPTSSSKKQQQYYRGITFILSGLEINVSEYNYIRDMLVQDKQHMVIAMKIHVNNILFCGVTHERYATRVKEIFDEVIKCSSTTTEQHEFTNSRLNRNNNKNENNKMYYNIVGHSAGAKFALMLASKIDPTRIRTVIAMDPVDLEPTPFHGPIFTNDDDSKNISFKRRWSNDEGTTTIPNIHIMFARDTIGNSIPRKHNAEAIYQKNADASELVIHSNANHAAYAEQGGGRFASMAFTGGTPEGNEAARKDVLRRIKKLIH